MFLHDTTDNEDPSLYSSSLYNIDGEYRFHNMQNDYIDEKTLAIPPNRLNIYQLLLLPLVSWNLLLYSVMSLSSFVFASASAFSLTFVLLLIFDDIRHSSL